jgi:hypothetical protein
MREAWFDYEEIDGDGKGRAVVANSLFYTFVNEVGTKGKGGELPTIRPVKAKALFIPITERAHREHKANEDAAVQITSSGFKKAKAIPHYLSRILGFSPLIKGRLLNGKLQKWDAINEKYVDGIPDFIFLQKVDIPPRPQLPTSDNELEAQVDKWVDLTLGPK